MRTIPLTHGEAVQYAVLLELRILELKENIQHLREDADFCRTTGQEIDRKQAILDKLNRELTTS